MKDRQQTVKRRVLIVLLLLTLAFIWGQSLLSRQDSARESGAVLEFFRPLLSLLFGSENITEHLVRKLAHFSEYTLFGIELLLVFKSGKKRKLYAWPAALLSGLAAAAVDEILQIFSGRGPAVSDVLLDFAGVFTGSVLALAVCAAAGAVRRRKER